MSANTYHIPVSSNVLSDLDLPSGGKVQVRSIEVEDLIEMDLLDSLDMLGETVNTDHVQRVKGTKKPSDKQPKKLTKAQQEVADGEKLMSVMKDKEKFGQLRTTIDRVIVRAVVQPVVQLAYFERPGGKLEPHDQPMRDGRGDGIWTDQLDFSDKMHIFSHVLPSGDTMKPFREERTEAVGDVDDQSASEDKAE